MFSSGWYSSYSFYGNMKIPASNHYPMKQLILFILTSLFWVNCAFSQPIIKIKGSDDSLAIHEHLVQYLTYLEVREKVYISVIFSKTMPGKMEGMTFCLDTILNNYLLIKVWIDARLSEKQQRLVLAHETIHVKQYVKEELKVIDHKSAIWKGRFLRHQYTGSRQTLSPWEREAYRADNLLTRQYKEQLKRPVEFEKPLIASEAGL